MTKPVNWSAVRIICLDSIRWMILKRLLEQPVAFLILILTGFLCLYLIRSFLLVLFILNLLFYFCSGVCSIIPFQRCRLILCNIEEKSDFSTIAKFSIDCNRKKKNVWSNISSDVFLYRILLSTLQYRGVTFCIIGRIKLFKT